MRGWRSSVVFVGLLALFACTAGPAISSESHRVINGEPTPAGLFPATGAIMVDFGSGLEPSCSGTLIAPNAVLTAAHCLDELFTGNEVPSFTLLADARNASGSDVVPGASAHQHEGFSLDTDAPNGLVKWDDIGVLLLSRDVEDAELEILPGPNEADALESGQTVQLVGYGLISQESFEVGIKHHGTADLVEVGEHELLIAEPGQQQNCNGDSGGPALVDLGDGRRIVGVVSRSPDDNPVCDHGGIDTRVDPYLEWIAALVTVPCGGLEAPCGESCEGDDCGDDSGGCNAGAGKSGSSLVFLLVMFVVFGGRRRR